jgi:hypothetical protein
MFALGSLNFLVSGFPDSVQPRQKTIEPYLLHLLVATIVPVTFSGWFFRGGRSKSFAIFLLGSAFQMSKKTTSGRLSESFWPNRTGLPHFAPPGHPCPFYSPL